jgi:hypothetical protein
MAAAVHLLATFTISRILSAFAVFAHLDEILASVEIPGPDGGRFSRLKATLLDAVFDRFFRIQNRESHDPARSGGGVGLALAKQLVETQAGRIWIEGPEAGRGTIVVVLLPTTTS